MKTAATGPSRNRRGMLTPAMRERLRRIRLVALDMDGTIYCGERLFPFTLPFLRQLGDLSVSFSFLTNNSSKSAVDYAAKLARLGIEVEVEQVHTSTHATLSHLAAALPEVRRVFLIGTDSMAAEVRAVGYVPVGGEDEPDAVLVGFDPAPDFSRLCKAAYWIKRGKPFIATHPDKVCPTDQPTVLLDCGSVCAMLECATGRRPDAIPGKPDAAMLLELGRKLGLPPEALAMAGDRLYTDMEMARRAGALGVLVLTGEATREQALEHDTPPDLVLPDLAAFGGLLQAARHPEIF